VRAHEARLPTFRVALLLTTALAFAATAAQQLALSGTSSQSPPQGTAQPAKTDLRTLASLDPIDTHTHVAKGDPSFYAMLDRLHMRILDILLIDDHDSYRKAIEPQLEDALRVVRESHGHAMLCTSFDPFQLGQTDFPSSAIQALA